MAEARSASSLSPQEQARIRRERRQAKVRETGNSRLNRITATQGTDFRREESNEPSRPESPAPQSEFQPRIDTPEINVSKRLSPQEAHAASHFTPSTSAQDEIRQAMMLDQLYRPRGGNETPSPSGTGGIPRTEDPLMQLLQQLSGGGGMPPGMEEMLGSLGGMGGMPGMGTMGGIGGMGQPPPAPTELKKNLWGSVFWTILHAVASVVLTVWVLRSSPGIFDGSELQRTESASLARSEKPKLFWYFSTMELLLQSTRFVIEKGRPPQGSMLSTIAGFLPKPFSTWIGTLARYSIFLWAILADAGVVIFVLGVASWWNS